MKILIVICAFSLTEVKLQENVIDEDNSTEFLLYLKERMIKLDLRIIGGADVSPHAYPFQAVLFTQYQQETSLCGGTLISPRWILTAAHCLDGNPKYIDVILGAHNLTSEDTTAIQTFRSRSYKMHADYVESVYANDIAVIKLPKNATLNGYVNVVSLSSGTDTYEGDDGVILGWGLTEDGSISETLKGVSVEVISNEACKRANAVYNIVTESHVCVSGTGPKGSCGGDSGGPLLVNGTQIGLVSFGTSNCSLGMPSVFTRLNQYNDWIAENTNSSAGIFKIRSVVVVLLLVVLISLIHMIIDVFV